MLEKLLCLEVSVEGSDVDTSLFQFKSNNFNIFLEYFNILLYNFVASILVNVSKREALATYGNV
jgi:hypothetical protein